MTTIAFDNEKYLQTQSAHIRERIAKFGGKLYLEFGGKLYDDNHASRVLPGFQPDSKLRMLLQLKEQVEMVIVINANDIEKNKIRGDLGITYDRDVIRLINVFRDFGLYVSSVVLTRFREQSMAKAFQSRLESMGIRVYHHYDIDGYPNDTAHIVSAQGFGKNDYIETTRSLVVVTAPGPGSGKLAVCLSQLYHEHEQGNTAGYAKFETFPIWNLPLNHPVNLAYEAATADLNDVNMMTPSIWKPMGRRPSITTGMWRPILFWWPFLKKFWATAPISPPRIWVSTWWASASLTMRPPGKPPGRRSSAAIMLPCAI